jgi:hypothetical protein
LNISNICYFQIADITIKLQSALPILEETFNEKLKIFQVSTPGPDLISLSHHFPIPKIDITQFGHPFYSSAPWAIYRLASEWLYWGILPEELGPGIHRAAIFNCAHTFGDIYSPDSVDFKRGNIQSLSLFPTDQIWIARLLADRQSCYLHAAGMILEGQGYLFVGHSGAGKSSMVTMLQKEGEILCDDRMIVRRWPAGFQIHGTWNHGDVPVVSPNSAPLRAILLLEQAPHNRLVPITDHREIVHRLPFFVVKPLITADWWEKTLDLVGEMAREVPVYHLQFDKSGGVRQVLKELY